MTLRPSPLRIVWIGTGATLFNHPHSIRQLQRRGIVLVDDISNAHVVASDSRNRLLAAAAFRPFKRFLLWTNEPRHDRTFPETWWTQYGRRKFKFFNVYHNNVFFHNLHFLGAYSHIIEQNLGIDLHSVARGAWPNRADHPRPRCCVAVFQYRDPRKSRLSYRNKNIDLTARRQDIALALHKRGIGDIYGGQWPESIVSGRSGFDAGNKQWWVTKIDLLQHYRFSIAFENTAWPFYCTEKLWHALYAGNLPLYWGAGCRIKDDLPSESFIDVAEIGDLRRLGDILEGMPEPERCRRVEAGRAKMQELSRSRLLAGDYLSSDILHRFVDDVQYWLA